MTAGAKDRARAHVGVEVIDLGQMKVHAQCTPVDGYKARHIPAAMRTFKPDRAWEDLTHAERSYLEDCGIDPSLYGRARKRFASIEGTARRNSILVARRSPMCRPETWVRNLACGDEDLEGRLTLGFDTEWFGTVEFDEDYMPHEQRNFLSAQFSTEVDGFSYDFVFYDVTTPTRLPQLGSCLRWICNTWFRGFGWCQVNAAKKSHKSPYYYSSQITLVGHFSGVDYSMFSDWKQLFSYRGLTTEEEDELGELKAAIEAEDSDAVAAGLRARADELESKKKAYIDKNMVVVKNKHVVFTTRPRVINYWTYVGHRERTEFRIIMRDTMALAAPHSSLASLGEALGLPKLDTGDMDQKHGKTEPNYYKSHMDELMADEPGFYWDYAIRDARIAYLWYRMICQTLGDGVTIGSITARKARSFIQSRGLCGPGPDPGEASAEALEKAGVYHIARGYWREPGDLFPLTRGLLGDLPAKCFAGGRNECFTYGTVRGLTVDYDVKGAYTLPPQCMPTIDWSRPMTVYPAGHVLVPGDFPENPFSPGFGIVDFDFPADVPYPCIPARDGKDQALAFLRSGRGVPACAPDVRLALHMGATATVRGAGFFFPQHVTDPDLKMSPVGQALREFVLERARQQELHGRHSTQDLLWKLVCNTLYGKTGQGTHEKMVRNFLDDEMNAVPESSVTDAVTAATITSCVRVIVSLAMHEMHEAGYATHSVTTDGFICDMPIAKLDWLCNVIYDYAPDLKTAIEDCYPGKRILEVNAAQMEFDNIKTRGNVCRLAPHVPNPKKPGELFGVVFARAGYRGDEAFRFAEPDDQRRIFSDVYRSRRGRVVDTRNLMISLRDMKHSELYDIERFCSDPKGGTKLLSLNPDAKRFICGVSGGYFVTRPHVDEDEYARYKAALDRYYELGYDLRPDSPGGRDERALRYALEHGLPDKRAYRPLDVTHMNYAAEVEASFRERQAYEARQAILLVRRPEFAHDPFVRDVIDPAMDALSAQAGHAGADWRREMSVAEIASAMHRTCALDGLGGDEAECLSRLTKMWRSATAHKSASFDYQAACRIWDLVSEAARTGTVAALGIAASVGAYMEAQRRDWCSMP